MCAWVWWNVLVSATEQLWYWTHPFPTLGFIYFLISFQSFAESVSFWIGKYWAVCTVKHSLLAPSTVQLQYCQWCGSWDWREAGSLCLKQVVSNQVQPQEWTQKPVLVHPMQDLDVLPTQFKLFFKVLVPKSMWAHTLYTPAQQHLYYYGYHIVR